MKFSNSLLGLAAVATFSLCSVAIGVELSDAELLQLLDESGYVLSEEQKQEALILLKQHLKSSSTQDFQNALSENALINITEPTHQYHLQINGMKYKLPQSCLLSREFGDDSAGREFGDDSAGREFGDDSAGREFGDDSAGREFGDDSAGREFGDDSAGREFGDDSAGREFGDDSAGREFGDDSAGREFGDDSAGREFGDDSAGREFGDDSAGREFGDDSAGREFGDDSAGREFGDGQTLFICHYDSDTATTTITGLTGLETIELMPSADFKTIEQKDNRIIVTF